MIDICSFVKLRCRLIGAFAGKQDCYLTAHAKRGRPSRHDLFRRQAVFLIPVSFLLLPYDHKTLGPDQIAHNLYPRINEVHLSLTYLNRSNY
ncbi:hypothetical protein HD806DRAFT_250950 [Xylariaceae sp. AK1471]|nr:hypothetical protein HD806DRAFT_250950 [Xylariaceae sp. AK1471]